MSYLQIAVNLDLPSCHIIQNCQVFENSYAVKIFWAVVLIWLGQTFFWDSIRVFFPVSILVSRKLWQGRATVQ